MKKRIIIEFDVFHTNNLFNPGEAWLDCAIKHKLLAEKCSLKEISEIHARHNIRLTSEVSKE